MKSLIIQPVMYNKIHKIFVIAYGSFLVLLIAYLFLLLTSASDVISFKTFSIMVITFIISSVIPFASYRLLENANKADKNIAITEYARLLEQKYNVKFNRHNSAYINQACVFVNIDTGEKFWGMATVDEDGKTPILKTFSNYTSTKVDNPDKSSYAKDDTSISNSKNKVKFSAVPRTYEFSDNTMSEKPDEMHRDVAMEISRNWED